VITGSEKAFGAGADIGEMNHVLTGHMMTKQARIRAYECSLAEDLLFERRGFHQLFSTADRKERMPAFVERRKPSFTHR
jgi:enoyl-CoA hydratase